MIPLLVFTLVAPLDPTDDVRQFEAEIEIIENVRHHLTKIEDDTGINKVFAEQTRFTDGETKILMDGKGFRATMKNSGCSMLADNPSKRDYSIRFQDRLTRNHLSISFFCANSDYASIRHYQFLPLNGRITEVFLTGAAPPPKAPASSVVAPNG